MPFIDWIRVLVENYTVLQYLIVFLGAAFGGEVVMIALSFWMAQGLFMFAPFIIVAFLGTLSSDIMWFLMGRSNWANKLFNHRYTNGTVSIIVEAVRRISRGSDFVALLLANFVLASRVVLIMYVSKNNLPLGRFIYYEAVAIVLWLIAVVGIGYASGIGYNYIADTFQSIYATIGFILVIILFVIFIQILIEKRITKNTKDVL